MIGTKFDRHRREKRSAKHFPSASQGCSRNPLRHPEITIIITTTTKTMRNDIRKIKKYSPNRSSTNLPISAEFRTQQMEPCTRILCTNLECCECRQETEVWDPSNGPCPPFILLLWPIKRSRIDLQVREICFSVSPSTLHHKRLSITSKVTHVINCIPRCVEPFREW